jgi:hypothetical protein
VTKSASRLSRAAAATAIATARMKLTTTSLVVWKKAR